MDETPQPTSEPTPEAGPPPAWSPPPPPTVGIVAPVAPPPRPPSVLRRFRGVLVVVAVVVIVAAVGFVFRDHISGSASGLQLGDCFDVPASASATVQDVQHHPCTEPHGGEVFAVVTYPADATATYPASDAFDTFATAQCEPAFQTYTGLDFETATNLDASYLFPVQDGWSTGDRTVICYLEDAAGQPLTQSMRSPAP